MSTILNKGSLPIWVYIIVIIVGSFAVLCTIAFSIRCWCIRRKSLEPPAEAQPVRKMTVRRGRVVPASRYLSLTGSRFGIRQFEENDTPSIARSRSKSPFDWMSAITERKRMQPDDVSQLESGSIRSRTASVANAIYTRWNFSRSSHSVVSEKEPQISVQEIRPAQPEQAHQSSVKISIRQPSFSRPFAPRTPTSPLTNIRSQSPEQRPEPKETATYSVFPQRRSSRSSRINQTDGNLTRLDRRQQPDVVLQDPPSSKVEPQTNNLKRLQVMSLIPEAAHPNVGYRTRPSFEEQHPSVSSPALATYDNTYDQAEPLPSLRASKSQHDFQRNKQRRTLIIRSSLYPPTHKDVKKGTVLRKKSIRRAEMVAMVG